MEFPWKGTSQVTYVTQVPWGNETLQRTLWERLFVLTLWNMYVISSKEIPADITGGDDVATRKYKSTCGEGILPASPGNSWPPPSPWGRRPPSALRDDNEPPTLGLVTGTTVSSTCLRHESISAWPWSCEMGFPSGKTLWSWATTARVSCAAGQKLNYDARATLLLRGRWHERRALSRGGRNCSRTCFRTHRLSTGSGRGRWRKGHAHLQFFCQIHLWSPRFQAPLCLSESGTARSTGESALLKERSPEAERSHRYANTMRTVSFLESWLSVLCSQASNAQTVCISTRDETRAVRGTQSETLLVRHLLASCHDI